MSKVKSHPVPQKLIFTKSVSPLQFPPFRSHHFSPGRHCIAICSTITVDHDGKIFKMQATRVINYQIKKLPYSLCYNADSTTKLPPKLHSKRLASASAHTAPPSSPSILHPARP